MEPEVRHWTDAPGGISLTKSDIGEKVSNIKKTTSRNNPRRETY
jgi:hypothetical protein